MNETSSSESDESDVEDSVEILKPVFVRKENRISLKSKEEKLKLEEEWREKAKLAEEKKGLQSRVLVAESLRRVEDLKLINTNLDESEVGLPDDSDNLNDSAELDAWKVREMSRLKRDTEEKEAAIKEKNDLLRRRGLTDAERALEDEKLGKFVEKEKTQHKFLQRYYHKGAFYMDEQSLLKSENDVRLRVDQYAAAPTLEDQYDKEELPQILQVKNFGKRSRTKYTHLLDQDTTVKISNEKKTKMVIEPDMRIMSKYLNKRSGVGDI